MSNDNVVSLAAPAEVSDPLTDLLRAGARRLIEAAVSAEFGEYLSAFEEEKLPDGRRRVVRNGFVSDRTASPNAPREVGGIGTETSGAGEHVESVVVKAHGQLVSEQTRGHGVEHAANGRAARRPDAHPDRVAGRAHRHRFRPWRNGSAEELQGAMRPRWRSDLRRGSRLRISGRAEAAQQPALPGNSARPLPGGVLKPMPRFKAGLESVGALWHPERPAASRHFGRRLESRLV